MDSLFALSAKLVLDRSGFDRDVDDSERKGRKLGDSLQKNVGEKAGAVSKGLKKLAKASVAGIAAAATAVVGFSVKAMGAAGELEQQIGGSEAVWGEYAQRMQKQGEEAFKNLGLSQAEYLANANKMGSLLMGSGLSAADSVELTSKAMQRAADVASIMGISVEDAMAAINGAAKGNFTMMDNLGVAINDTSIQAYAMQKGMSKQAAKNLSQQEKIQLAFELFFQNTEYAAGNYAKENDTLAGSLGTLKAAFANMMAGAGSPDQVVEAIDMALDAILRTFEELAPKIIPALEKIITSVSKKLPDLLQRALPVVIQGIQMLLGALIKILPTLIESLVAALPEIITGIVDLIPNLLDALEAVFTVVFNNLPQILSALLTGAANAIIAILNKAFGLNLPKIEDIRLPTWDEIKTGVATWWTDIKAKLKRFCVWFLGGFLGVDTTNADGSSKTPGQIVGEWWDGVKKSVVEACAWKLGSFLGVEVQNEDGTTKSPVQIVSEWWDGLKADVVKACSWKLGSFLGVSPTASDGSTKSPGQIVSEWWSGLKADIVRACSWKLGSFLGVSPTASDGSTKSPGQIVGEWWGGIKDSVRDACEWTLKLFKNPTEAIPVIKQKVAGWWAGKKQAAMDALDWALKLFNVPEADAEKVKDTVGGWWDTVSSGAEAACDWVLKLFNKPKETMADVQAVVSGWWTTAGTWVQDACGWVLKLFGKPTEEITATQARIGEWWANAQGWVESACNWVLKLFQNPKEAVGDVKKKIRGWWSKAGNWVSSACDWVLGIFGWPAEGKEDVKSVVGGWWTTIGNAASEACNWLLGIFTGVDDDAENGGALGVISKWWSGVKDAVISTCSWFLGLFGGVGDTNSEGKTLSDVVSAWWGTVRDTVVGICTWVLNLFGLPDPLKMIEKIGGWWTGAVQKAGEKATILQIGIAFLQNAADAIRKWWSGEDENGGVYGEIKDWLKAKIGIELPDWTKIRKEIVKGWNQWIASLKLTLHTWVQNNWRTDKTFLDSMPHAEGDINWDAAYDDNASISDIFSGKATGLDFVPQNDYLVRTHFGEAILNRHDADDWRNGRGRSEIDYDALGAAVAAALTGITVDLDGERVGELISPTVNEAIGTIAHNERYNRG